MTFVHASSQPLPRWTRRTLSFLVAGLPALPLLAHPSPSAPGQDPAAVRALADLPLACIDRPFPSKPSHLYETADQVRPPSEWTPVFFGCFDHHSAVHGHWSLVRILKTFPESDVEGTIRNALDRHLRPELLEREAAFFREDRNRTFERPYGWAWLLRLASELESFDDPDARRWAAAMRPLAGQIARNLADYLPRLSYPIREGEHPNTAFALAHAWDYALTVGDEALREAVRTAALRFFSRDADCPIAWEPSGEDFLSPCLAEADLMRRILPAAPFSRWLTRFLPGLSSRGFSLPIPEVRDPQDPRIGHLIGLSFHRAWALSGIAAALPPSDRRIPVLEGLAQHHRQAAMARIAESGYGGEHWLGTFALFDATAAGR